jgi:hypothetical protein
VSDKPLVPGTHVLVASVQYWVLATPEPLPSATLNVTA